MKSLAEKVIAAAARPFADRLRAGKNRLVLAYHNVVATRTPEEGERSAHLPLVQFCDHLDALQELTTVVPLSEILTDRQCNSRPQVAITFDDAYAGTVAFALPELAKRGLHCTVFVAPATLDQQSFWWDELADKETGILDQRTREHVLQELKGSSTLARDWAAACGVKTQTLGSAYRTTTPDALAALGSSPFVSFGAHSWTHRNLVVLPECEMREEIGKSTAWCEQFSEKAVDCFAYPYGSWNNTTQGIARSLGVTSTLDIVGGWFSATPKAFIPTPRFNVPSGLTAHGLQLRLYGMLTGPYRHSAID